MSPPPAAVDADTITYTAHRAFAGTAPENTLAAARRVAGRADRIELDVQPCADGTPVVFHDRTLDDLTDASGRVWETDRATVTDAEVLDSGQTVPTLKAYLRACPVPVNVELKHPGRDATRPGERLSGPALEAAIARWQPFVDRVADVLAGAAVTALYSSFCHGALAAAAATDDRPLATVEVGDGVGLATARAVDAEAVHARQTIVGPRSEGASPAGADRDGDGGGGDDHAVTDVVAAAHDEGRLIRAWTVETWHQAHRLAAAGVDGLIADYPALLTFTRSERDGASSSLHE